MLAVNGPVSLILPALLAFLGSLNSLWTGFAADDTQQVLNNQLIKELKNLPFTFTSSVWAFATSDIIFSVDSYYRPLFNVVLMINYAIFGTTAWGWHLVNVLIHTGVTLLVFKVLFELTRQRWVSMASACLFAVHPAHAESVAWISGVTDPLMSLLLLPGFYLYLRYRKTRQRQYLFLTLFAYFLALLSKETSLAFPLILVYCEAFYFTERASLKRRVQQALVLGFVFSLPTAVYFLMRYGVIGPALFGTGPTYPLGPALLTIPLAFAKYVKLMVVPWGHSYQHLTYFVESAGDIRFLGPAALLVVMTICITLIRSKLVVFSAAWFVVWLAPPLAALRRFDPEYLVQERYLYLPSVGFCLAVGLAIQWLSTRRQVAAAGRMIGAAALGLIVAVFGIANFAQNRTWFDSVSLIRNCVVVEPYSGRAHSALSRHYFLEGNTREAEAEARKAIELDPQFAGGYMNLSYFHKHYGKLDQAIDYLEQAVAAIEPSPMTRNSLATVHLNLGLLYSERKNPVLAEKNLVRSVELWSRAVGAYHLGMLYFNQSRFEEASRMLEQVAVQVPPRYAPIRATLGAVYERLGETDRARAEYARYLEIALPNAPDRAIVQQRLSALTEGSRPN
ncbi:MAG TPA: tetratricopeptide repeat protein [Blastocatellia bacterium]|nr:tetratricopeptide repeat protein [Blastocatellia bacterium]